MVIGFAIYKVFHTIRELERNKVIETENVSLILAQTPSEAVSRVRVALEESFDGNKVRIEVRCESAFVVSFVPNSLKKDYTLLSGDKII